MKNSFTHSGTVVSIVEQTPRADGAGLYGFAKVVIVQKPACASCQIKSGCTLSESKEKEITVAMREPLSVGDSVVVEVSQRLGWKALLLAYILPFLLVLAVLLIFDHWDTDETYIGIFALCIVGLYYIVLHFFRDRLQREFSITARRV